MKRAITALLCAAWLGILPGQLRAQNESPLSALAPGHWLEVRGDFEPDRGFTAVSADLVQPGRYQELIGTIAGESAADQFELLGLKLRTSPKTRIGLEAGSAMAGQRVKVEGFYRGEGRFAARTIRQRGPGRDRLTGRVDHIMLDGDRPRLEIMGITVFIEGLREVEHEERLAHYEISEFGIEDTINRNRDEEDMFGKGLRLGRHWLLAAQGQTRGTREDNFNLRSRDGEDLDEALAAFRARLVYQRDASFFAVAEVNHRRLWRDDEQDGPSHDDVTRLGEAYLYWLDPFENGLDLQVGRVDFDDEREWLFDQNLDAVRGIWSGARARVEYSYSETLSDGSPEDEAARNHFLYLSNRQRKRHLATWVMHREFDLPVPVRRTHVGFRALGKWWKDFESWLDLAWLDGRTGDAAQRGLAVDLGTTWQPGDHFAATLGFAWGQGDHSGSTTGRTYRQSGLQDNNGKFAGVTSFRYYGELVDPELANLSVLTAGIGWLPQRKMSLDLVWHAYRQDELSTRLVDTQLDRRPSGISKDIGSEVDLIFGWRAAANFDVEAVAAWFKPGSAFVNADDAYLAKLQFRFRY